MFYWLKLRGIRIKEQKKLNKINLKLFKKVILYINNSNLKYSEKEEALHQIMDIILQSQAEHRSGEIFIKDYEVFCKSIIEEYTKDKGFIYTGLHHFQRSIISMLLMLVPAILILKIISNTINTGIFINLFVLTMGYAFFLRPLSRNGRQKIWTSAIYLMVILWTNDFFEMTKWGQIIGNILINNTTVIFLGMLLMVAFIEIYKRVCDKSSY